MTNRHHFTAKSSLSSSLCLIHWALRESRLYEETNQHYTVAHSSVCKFFAIPINTEANNFVEAVREQTQHILFAFVFSGDLSVAS